MNTPHHDHHHHHGGGPRFTDVQVQLDERRKSEQARQEIQRLVREHGLKYKPGPGPKDPIFIYDRGAADSWFCDISGRDDITDLEKLEASLAARTEQR